MLYHGIDYLCYATFGFLGFLAARKLGVMIGMLFRRNFHFGLVGRLEFMEKQIQSLESEAKDTKAKLIALSIRLKLVETKVSKLMQIDNTITLV
jgi:hypothetical protein